MGALRLMFEEHVETALEITRATASPVMTGKLVDLEDGTTEAASVRGRNPLLTRAILSYTSVQRDAAGRSLWGSAVSLSSGYSV
jgi:hypothetical protein